MLSLLLNIGAWVITMLQPESAKVVIATKALTPPASAFTAFSPDGKMMPAPSFPSNACLPSLRL